MFSAWGKSQRQKSGSCCDRTPKALRAGSRSGFRLAIQRESSDRWRGGTGTLACDQGGCIPHIGHRQECLCHTPCRPCSALAFVAAGLPRHFRGGYTPPHGELNSPLRFGGEVNSPLRFGPACRAQPRSRCQHLAPRIWYVGRCPAAITARLETKVGSR
jgi:hypothetical protein